MALKQFYATEEEVPTELKEHYTQKDGRYILSIDGIDNLPGLASKNAELITKQKADKEEIGRLTNELSEQKIEVGKLAGDLSTANSKTTPRGYVAVKQSDADALKTFTEKGLKIDEVMTSLEELDGLKTKVNDFELDKAIKLFADVEKIQNVDALTRLIKQDAVTPIVKEVEKDGKKEKQGFLMTSGDKPEEKSYKEFLESNWKPFASSLDVKEKAKSPGTGHDPLPTKDTDETEAAKTAAAGQARATHSVF